MGQSGLVSLSFEKHSVYTSDTLDIETAAQQLSAESTTIGQQCMHLVCNHCACSYAALVQPHAKHMCSCPAAPRAWGDVPPPLSFSQKGPGCIITRSIKLHGL